MHGYVVYQKKMSPFTEKGIIELVVKKNDRHLFDIVVVQGPVNFEIFIDEIYKEGIYSSIGGKYFINADRNRFAFELKSYLKHRVCKVEIDSLIECIILSIFGNIKNA